MTKTIHRDNNFNIQAMIMNNLLSNNTRQRQLQFSSKEMMSFPEILDGAVDLKVANDFGRLNSMESLSVSAFLILLPFAPAPEKYIT